MRQDGAEEQYTGQQSQSPNAPEGQFISAVWEIAVGQRPGQEDKDQEPAGMQSKWNAHDPE